MERGLVTPKKFTLVAGTGEGRHELNAFDHALLAAGIGNMNLLRVSSILPPNCQHVEKFDFPAGSLLPTAYGSIVSEHPGELIAAAIAVGINVPENYGVIMEFSGKCSAAEAERTIREMVEEGFETRGLKLNQCLIKAVEHRVKHIGCAFAATALWY